MKHYYLSIFLAILLSMACAMVSAHDIAVANSDGKTIYYNYNSDGSSVSVTYQGAFYSSYSDEYIGDIVIPKTVTYSGKTYSVTSIDIYAFGYCCDLTSVTIPNSVTSISLWAFSYCSGLAEIKVANGNSVYDSRNNCNAIIETSTNTLIAGCKNTIIPNSVTSIGEGAFFSCSGLTSVTIPNSVTSIGEQAFHGCSGLTSVTIPNGVTSIGHRAFRGCSGLKKVIIPDIKNWCSIKFDIYDDNPLYYARHLYSDENTEITELVIPDGVTSIGNGAFWGCSGLTSVTIPNSVTSIGNGAFWGCSGLAEIKVANGNSVYDSRNDCNAIIETSTNTLIVGCKNTIIPNSVTSIGDYAFYNCSGLTSVTIGSSVTSIGGEAFEYCSGLTSVTIPNSVTSIGNRAFYNCSGLTSVTIPESVTSISSSAFVGCSGLAEIKVANGNSVYDSRNDCNAIIETSTNTLIVGCKNTIIPNSVTSIGSSAFSGCKGLTSVIIPNSVTSIGSSAFSYCI